MQTLTQTRLVGRKQQFGQLWPEPVSDALPFGENGLQALQERQRLGVERHFRGRHPAHLVYQRERPMEVKKRTEQLYLVFLACRRKCLIDSLYGRLAVGITQHGRVVVQFHIIERRREHDAFERPATGKCHIHLSGGKSTCRIDDHFVEGQTLTFMDRHRPREPQRILGERA